MALKGFLTPLPEADLFDEGQLAVLREHSITTVEELIGVIDADPTGLATMLHLAHDELPPLRHRALEMVAPSLRDALEQPARRYKLGALAPPRRA